MTVLSRAWGLAPVDARAQLVRLAQAASTLVRAFGGHPPAAPTTSSSTADVEGWETAYEQAAASADGPSVDTLSGLPRDGSVTLTWAAVVARYGAAPVAVRTAVVALRAAYSGLGNIVRNAVDDGAIRRWLVARADSAGYPNTQSLSEPVAPTRPARSGGGIIIAIIAAALVLGGRRRGAR